MTPGERVAAAALSKLGERESGGANRGPFVDMVNARWGLRGTPWCGAFADWCYHAAGVDDHGLCHPSTAEMRRRADAARAILPSSARAPAGALWLNDPNHVGVVIRDNGDGTVTTVDGNSGDAVAQRRRSKYDARIVVPIGIAVEPEPVRVIEYLLEDPAARPRLFGPWKSKANRDSALASLPARRRSSARMVRGKDGGYAFILGPRRLYGPWATKDARDEAQPILEKRTGRQLRPFSRKV